MVENISASPDEDITSLSTEFNRNYGIVSAMADRDGGQWSLEVQREALHRGDESAESDNRSRSSPIGAQPEGIAHDRALGKAAEDRTLRGYSSVLGQRRQPVADLTVRRQESLGVGEADPADNIPVRAERGKRERTPWGYPEQVPLRVKNVEERVEVTFVSSAPVEKDESPFRAICRMTNPVGECVDGDDRHVEDSPLRLALGACPIPSGARKRGQDSFQFLPEMLEFRWER